MQNDRMETGKNEKEGLNGWILCEAGSMPEDKVETYNMFGFEFTKEVIVRKFWGNEHGGGSYYPAYRYRRKGQKSWHWSFNTNIEIPLAYFPIPSPPGNGNYTEDFIKSVRERIEKEENEMI